MKNNCAEIYNAIVTAKIGELVCTKHKNGKEYGPTIEDMLRQQGYVAGKDFQRIFEWSTAKTYIRKMRPIKPYQAPKHDIKPGDIFYRSWGWEQTNIDYYQVIYTTAKTITLRQIKSMTTDYDAYKMTGHCEPVPNAFIGEPIRKTPYYSSGEWYISFDYSVGARWNGQPMYFSQYA